MWPWRAWTSASASSDATRSSSVSPIPTRIPLVNGICSSPAASIVSRRARRVLGRRAGVDGLHQALGDRLEHQPLRGGHLAQAGEVLAAEDAEVGVRQDAPLERPLAGPDDVGGEVVVAPRGEPRGDLGVDLGPLAGEDEQLLGVAPHRLLEPLLDLVGRVEVRPVGRERAVLAVALAGARERERVVAREGDPAHRRHATATRRRPTGPGALSRPAAGSVGVAGLDVALELGAGAFGTGSGDSVGGHRRPRART